LDTPLYVLLSHISLSDFTFNLYCGEMNTDKGQTHLWRVLQRHTTPLYCLGLNNAF